MKKIVDCLLSIVWFVACLLVIWALLSWADFLFGDGDWMFNMFTIYEWRWIK